MRWIYAILSLAATLCATAADSAASEIKRDENVVFFPTYGVRVDARHWEIDIRGWVFEWESRPGIRSSFRNVLGVDEATLTDLERDIFAARTRLFLIDAERGKKVSIRMAGRVYELPPSDPTGHFAGKIKIADAELVRAGVDAVSFQASTLKGDSRVFPGVVRLIEPDGLSVVSDIDDTIKVSDVRDRKKLLRNTFLSDFVPAPGMASLYQQWATNGSEDVCFHYLSASPSQLFEPLHDFNQLHGFPAGTFHLRAFNWKTELHNHSAPRKHKPAVLNRLLSDFPRRRFVLVGDSGESDPEIYADAARQFPEQVIKILIRDVTGEGTGAPRYVETFNGLSTSLWTIFKHPGEIEPLKFK